LAPLPPAFGTKSQRSIPQIPHNGQVTIDPQHATMKSKIHPNPLFNVRFLIITLLAAAGILFSNAALAQPTIANVYPNGIYQLQATNALSFTASSAAGITSVAVQLSGTTLTGGAILKNYSLGNGLTTSGSVTSYTVNAPLTTNVIYSATIQVTDGNSQSASTSVSFDTIAPAFSFEAEDYDYTSAGGATGQFFDNPQIDAYAGHGSTAGTDCNNGGGGNADYRPNSTTVAGQAGLGNESTGDKPRAAYANAGKTDYDIGWNNGGNWANYTRTYPAGTYNVYIRAANPNNASTDSAHLSVAAGTASFSGSGPYQFGVPTTGGWQTYIWVPLIDSSTGNPAQLTTDGSVSTLQMYIDGGNLNYNYIMFVSVVTNAPVASDASVSSYYPDGTMQFQDTNEFAFTITSTLGVIPANIAVQLTGTSLTGQGSTKLLTSSSGLTISGVPTSLNVSFTITSNTTYKAFMQITDANGNPAVTNITFDTVNPNYYTFEAEDFNYGSGDFFDNPQTNAYYGLDGVEGTDFYLPGTQSTSGYIRAGLNTEPCGDVPRAAFHNTLNYYGEPSADYDVGNTAGGQWGNYTRTYPAGVYNVFIRASDGNGGSSDSCSLDLVTSDPTQPNQTFTKLGNFSVPTTGGWQTYTWVPLIDAGGNVGRFNATGSPITLRMTVDNGNFNGNYFMLVPADLSVKILPFVTGFQPDGTSALFQYTNQATFTVNSSAGTATSNVVVKLDGAVVNNLSFSGSPTLWNVTMPVSLNAFHTAIITVTDSSGSVTTTNTFGTFSSTNYEWMAVDYDYNGGKYFDNPQVGSYAGLGGTTLVDMLESDVNGPGRGNSYRAANGTDFPDATAGDLPLAQFTASGLTDYNLGSFGNGSWANYTRHYPAGSYTVVGRFAEGAGLSGATLSQLTSGYGTTTQTTQLLGTFTVPAAGWSSWEWVPMLDNTGKPARFTLDGTQQTLQLAGNNNSEVNVNFLMLVPIAPMPQLTAAVGAGNITVSFPTVSGYNYQLLSATNLMNATWTPVGGSLPGNGSTQSVNAPNPGGSCFYRMSIQ
jgi:hypothetical protein